MKRMAIALATVAALGAATITTIITLWVSESQER